MYQVHLYDLEKQQQSIKKVPEKVHKSFIGGRSLASWWAFEHIPARIPSLSKHNQIIFATGPLTGSRVIGANRTSCAFQSPITGTISTSSVGGRFGQFLKNWNVNMLVITGELQKNPRDNLQNFLVLEDGKFRIESFPHLFSANIEEARNYLQQEIFSSEHLIVLTGTAARKGLYYANVSTEPHHFFGRGGLGAVFHSKRLRGLIIAPKDRNEQTDSSKRKDSNPEKTDIIHRFNNYIRSTPTFTKVSTKGTLSLLQPLLLKKLIAKKQLTEDLDPSRLNTDEKNFFIKLGVDSRVLHHDQVASADTRASTSDDKTELTLNVLNDPLENINDDDSTISREKTSESKPARKEDVVIQSQITNEWGDHLTYHSHAKLLPWLCLGPNLNQFSVHVVRHSINLCNDAGIDVISISGALGNLAYLAARGHFPEMDLFKWNKKRLNDLISDVLELKPPLDDWLATGESYLLEQKGMSNGTCIKNMHVGPFSPRNCLEFYLGALISTRGGCHLRGGMGWMNHAENIFPVKNVPRNKVIIQTVSLQTIYLQILDTLGLDYYIYFAWLELLERNSKGKKFLRVLTKHIKSRFLLNDTSDLLHWLSEILTKLEIKEEKSKWRPKDLWNAGLRGYLTEHLYNLRNGITDGEDTLFNERKELLLNKSENDYRELLLSCHAQLFLDEDENPQKKMLKALQLDSLLTKF